MPCASAIEIARLWQAGPSNPDVFSYLSQQGPTSPEETLEVVLEDQQFRWRRGCPLTVEQYLAQLPSLASRSELRLQLVLGEFRARQHEQSPPSVDDFTRRFPELGDELRRQAELASSLSTAADDLLAATWSFQSLPPVQPVQERIGRYRLVRILGEGGFGRVWLGFDEELRRQVAVKVPRADSFQHSCDAESYLAEARALATVDHPHIVPVYDVGRTPDGAVYVVSKYIAGQNLAQRLQTGRLASEEAVRIAAAVATALHHAHQKRLVHRDVKPANILIDDVTQQVFVSDFGLAIDPALARDDTLLAGTPAYMSPEQARAANAELDGRSDIFSLGAVLFELLTGRRPFAGGTLVEVLERIQHDEVVFPAVAGGTVSPELERICRKMLAKTPADRYSTAGELAAELQRWLNQRPDVSAAPRPAMHNLPAEVTALVGRTADIARIQELLATARLVTLTGPGGIGKTRLAIAAGRAVLREFPEGVFLVELAAVRDPALVASAIAQALGCHSAMGGSNLQALQAALAGKRTLLIIDNCEHLLAGVSDLAMLMATCPELRILATSQSPLRLSGEHEYAVPLLPLPSSIKTDWESLAQNPAVALFVERARAATPGFTLNRDNAAAVAQICLCLDGLPLAIELAAARTRVLPPRSLLERLNDRLAILTGGRRDGPERQRTLRSTIAWSHELLTADEQVAFRRLAVFGGGCSLDAAEAILSDNGQELDVLDCIASLVDKNLLRRGEVVDEMPRFEFLEAVRQFATERLAASDEGPAFRRRHAEYFTSLAEQLSADLRGPQTAQRLTQLSREHANLRAALEWSVSSAADGSDAARGELGLRIVGALWRFWCLRGHLREAGKWSQAVLALGRAQQDDGIVARASYAAGCLAEDLGEFATAEALYERSQRIWTANGDLERLADAEIALGSIRISQARYPAAQAHFQRALDISQQRNNQRLVAVACSNLGSLHWSTGQYDQAHAQFSRSLAIRRQLRDSAGISISLTSLGLIESRKGNYLAARQLYLESLDILRELDNRPGIGVCLNNLGEIACRLGECDAAQQLVTDAIRLQLEIGDPVSLTYSLESYASIKLQQNDVAAATRFAGAAGALRESLGAPLAPLEQANVSSELAAMRSALGDERFQTLWNSARDLPLDEFIAQELPEVSGESPPASKRSEPAT